MNISGYLVYHPKREVSEIDDIMIYHDKFGSNQDPYVWNRRFLHTYCHITQMKPEIGHINYWVSGDTFPEFSCLYCDLVFVVEYKQNWEQPNTIDINDPIIDTPAAYRDHYCWVKQGQHKYTRRHRFTLKADPQRSFQPQHADNTLIDIVPFLSLNGIELAKLRRTMRAGFNSRPYPLNKSLTDGLYLWIEQEAEIKLTGELLETLRKE
jgi:hypothetical protein